MLTISSSILALNVVISASCCRMVSFSACACAVLLDCKLMIIQAKYKSPKLGKHK
jgi:hypothetical protein